MQVRFCLKVSVYFWGHGIWVSSTSFQKINIRWPQQPPTETVPTLLIEKIITLKNARARVSMVWSSMASKWPVLVIFCGMVHQKSKLSLIYGTVSVGGCWGQPMLLFWKLVDETQMPWPQEYTDTFKQNLTCIFLSVRVNSKETFQCETPCRVFENFWCSKWKIQWW